MHLYITGKSVASMATAHTARLNATRLSTAAERRTYSYDTYKTYIFIYLLYYIYLYSIGMCVQKYS